MPADDVPIPDLEQISDCNRESVEKIKALVNELKIVDGHEKHILGVNTDEEPPLFKPPC